MAAKKATKKRTSKKRKATTKKASAKTESAAEAELKFPRRIFAMASPRSLGGLSMFEADSMIDAGTVAHFDSDPGLVQAAVIRLEAAGFEILQVTTLMINIAGSRTTYERAFNTKLVIEQRLTVKESGEEELAEFIDTTDTEISGLIRTDGTEFEDVLEGVAIEEPRYFQAIQPLAPPVDYWHLDVPGDVSLGLNADRAHRGGITGKGVKIAMVDSGWERHPFFVERGYRSADAILGPATANADTDENGHGTGESANIFSVAPDVQLMPVKTTFVNVTGAFNAAVGLNPDIITNSWGFSVSGSTLSAAQQALAASVAAAVSSGIVVVFSAGNGSKRGFPAQHPDVISVGGVYRDQDGSLQASDYASGFVSNVYPGRRVPDVSGLVGMQPGASYIMLPVPEGCQIDVNRAGGNHPPGDETANDDGWAAFSGTSAAAPQVAGAVALVLQACPRLTPAQVKDILETTARDVTTGTGSLGAVATVGPDTATGHGLVDAHKAVLVAKLRCALPPLPPILPPINVPINWPVRPPITPPVFPPVRPPLVPPLRPPLIPILPPIRQPIGPIAPLFPLVPIRFDEQQGAASESGAGADSGLGPGLSAEDVEYLEQMVLDDDNPLGG